MKMENKEKIEKKTIEFLLKNAERSEDLELIEDAIVDYEEDGSNLRIYKKQVKELKEKGYWT